MNLHSTMVRFIIEEYDSCFKDLEEFTFHYGQIYYSFHDYDFLIRRFIYIPLWLDLLCRYCLVRLSQFVDLHSTMVRFIMGNFTAASQGSSGFTFHYGQIYYRLQNHEENCKTNIYIPLWLDLLLKKKYNLIPSGRIFTFHYGQIYY